MTTISVDADELAPEGLVGATVYDRRTGSRLGVVAAVRDGFADTDICRFFVVGADRRRRTYYRDEFRVTRTGSAP